MGLTSHFSSQNLSLKQPLVARYSGLAVHHRAPLRSGAPLVSPPPSLRPTTRPSQRIEAYKVDVGDRILASVPYLLPLFDGLRYGRFFLTEYPIFTRLIAPFFPIYELYMRLPFASIATFFAVYFGMVRNQSLRRYIRFNAMQAILVDILLVLPSLIESLFRPNMSVTVVGYNTVWIYVFVCVTYGIGSCLMGEQARLPLVADAADSQVQ